MDQPHVQTKREIEATLSGAGLRPRKRHGQHFLIDGNLMRRLAASAEIERDDLILEVGGGTGGLTDLLAARSDHVLCVEIDRALFTILQDRFQDQDNVELLLTDVLKSKHRIAPEIVAALQAHADMQISDCNRRGQAEGRCKLVANLPYKTATPVLINLLTDCPMVRRFCFTVQAEVGQRILAEAHTKAYGPVSILARSLCTIDVIARLPPHVFWPRPAVESVMIRMTVNQTPFCDVAEAARFAALLRGTFDHRRKTLRSALGFVLDAAVINRVLGDIDGRRRPESLSVQEWLNLFRSIEQD